MKTTIIICCMALAQFAFAQKGQFTESFGQENCEWTTTGKNQYFILEPNYQLVLQGIEEKDTVTLIITVLNEIKKVGDIETRVVEEREMVNGQIVEVSRNFFAICKLTNSVYYFGEEVDMYKDGKLDNHAGAWQADQSGCKSGVMMPGIILLGARYYQEIAPKVAMDRAEIINTGETVQTPAGTFNNCLTTEETTPLEPKSKENKYYAAGIGLISDSDLLLVKYGFVR